MREILFRGKRVDNGEWVCSGNLIHFNGDNECYIPVVNSKCTCTHDENDNIIEWNEVMFCKVIPKTVGQYTGVTDKNDKKIFEGDIIRTQPYSDRPYSRKAKFKQHIGVVEYKIRHFKNSLYKQDYDALWEVNIKDYGKYGCYDWSAFFKCEVIGNIHDNPELLGEEV